MTIPTTNATTKRLTRTLALALVVLAVGMLFAPMASAQDLEYGDERAELDVYQPSWVDNDISVDRTDNRTIYGVSGDKFEVYLQNVDHDDVQRVSVADGEADVSYDEARDTYVVNPGGEGTVGIYWVAEVPVDDDGNGESDSNATEGNETNGTTETSTGETKTVRYAASMQVSNTNWEHLKEGELADTRQDAENWSTVVSEANEIAPGKSVDKVLSTGLGAAQFLMSPFGSLSTDVQGTLIMMTARPGGLLVLSVFLALISVTAAVGFRWRHKFKSQLGDHDRVKEELRGAWMNKAEKIAQQWEWWQILPDRAAQWMHDTFGPNCWHGLKDYQVLRTPTHTKGLLLQCMGQIGYSGVAHYDADGNLTHARALTDEEYDDEYGGIDVDGGSDDGDGGLPDVIDVPPDDTAPDGGVMQTERIETFEFEELRFDERDHRKVIDAIPSDDLDESVFLPSVDIDLSKVSLPIDNHDIDDAELVRELDPQIPGDFESYEQFARVQAKLMEWAVNHPHYTDEDGRVREEMDLLSFMAELDSALADKAEFAPADTERKLLYMIAEEIDANDRVDETVADAHANGVGRDDETSSDVIGIDDIDLGGSTSGGGPA